MFTDLDPRQEEWLVDGAKDAMNIAAMTSQAFRPVQFLHGKLTSEPLSLSTSENMLMS